MASMAEAFGQTTGSFDGTQVFTPQYAYEHEDDEDEDGEGVDGAPQRPPPAHYEFAEDEEDGEEADVDGDELEQLDDEQLVEESQRDHPHSDSDIVKSSKLTAQDYIPKKLVGHTYGPEPWQLHRPPNPLSERQAYVRTGSNGVFEVRPAVLNFAGFHLGNAYTQHVSIVNVSVRSQRLHLLQPTTPAFRLSCNKKGAIAPGMSEQLAVRFEPTEYRYYADCVRVHALGENLLLPLHAYPALNAVHHAFPSLVDMGAVAVGQRASKRVQMVCDVPVQFEFRLTALNQNPDFAVFPTQGVVPANGSVWVTIEYLPTRAVTSTLQLQVDVSQMGFKAFVCTVTGHSHVLQQNAPIAPQHKQTKTLRQKRLAAAAHLNAIMPSALTAASPSRLRPAAAAAAGATLDRPKAAGVRK